MNTRQNSQSHNARRSVAMGTWRNLYGGGMERPRAETDQRGVSVHLKNDRPSPAKG